MMDGPVWLIGCGNMGGAMLKGWLANGMDPGSITVIDPAPSAVPSGLRVLSALPVDDAKPALIVLAIKPQQFGELSNGLAPLVSVETTLISILAGVEVATLRAGLPAIGRIIRAMPNMPASIGEGITVLCGTQADPEVTALMRPLGGVDWISDENLFHAVTAVSGSGPAFAFRYISAVAAAGVSLGLAPDLARRLALATVRGSAALAEATDTELDALVEQVRSPNGTTHAGLTVLDGSDLRGILMETLAETARRSADMATEAR